MATGEALPARPPDGEVCLSGKVHLSRATIPVTEIRLVYVAHVQSHTLVRVPNRPAVRVQIKIKIDPRRETINQWAIKSGWREREDFVYSRKPSSVST